MGFDLPRNGSRRRLAAALGCMVKMRTVHDDADGITRPSAPRSLRSPISPRPRRQSIQSSMQASPRPCVAQTSLRSLRHSSFMDVERAPNTRAASLYITLPSAPSAQPSRVVVMRLRGKPHVVIGPMPARLLSEVHGEIESAFAGKIAFHQAHPVPAEGKRRGWAVFDSLPSV